MKKKRATVDSWRNQPLPSHHKELLLSGTYSRAEYVRLSMGYIPQGPDESE